MLTAIQVKGKMEYILVVAEGPIFVTLEDVTVHFNTCLCPVLLKSHFVCAGQHLRSF